MSEISELGERHDEQELDAFLQGQDALSRELRSLPQVGPSKALDAAILLKIEAALAEEARLKIAQTETNKDAFKDAAKSTSSSPSFFFRILDVIGTHLKSLWLIPLGLAAGVIFTVTVKPYFDKENVQNMPNAMTGQLSKNHASKALAASDQKVMANTASESIAKETTSAIPPASTTVIALHHISKATSKKRQEASPPADAERPTLADLDKNAPIASKIDEIQRVTVTGSSVKRIESEGSLPVVSFSRAESKPVSEKSAANNDATMIALQRQDQTTMGRSGRKVSVLADKTTSATASEEDSYLAKADYATKQNAVDTRATATHNPSESVNDYPQKNVQGNIALAQRKSVATPQVPASAALTQVQKQISEVVPSPAPVAPMVQYAPQAMTKIAPLEETPKQRVPESASASEGDTALSSPTKSAPGNRNPQLNAERWLELIASKLAQGETGPALQEWKQFKLSYPDFAVPATLNKKIKAAQNKK